MFGVWKIPCNNIFKPKGRRRKMTITRIDNTEDIIDIRDIIERVEHLEQLRQPGSVDLGPEDNEADQDSLFAELATLESLLSDLEGNGGDHDWRGNWYPITLIRDSYFEDYAQQLAEDIGAIDPNATWPLHCIDWEKAASELQMDYSQVEYDGETYWYR
jgi:hypothetical protein